MQRIYVIRMTVKIKGGYFLKWNVSIDLCGKMDCSL
jgi:hypothetical protein